MDIKKTKSKDNTLPSRGVYGSPKKGGAGGKGTWGVGGIGDLVNPHVDRKDPNYDSDEEAEVVLKKVQEMESPLQQALKEFFVEADFEEAARRVQELNGTVPYSEFVRKAMVSSMEKQPFERELVSKLLSALYGSPITSEEFAEGFQVTLDKLEDIVIDVPNAAEMLGKFIARAIVDEIIPPSFLKHAKAASRIASESIALANGLVTDNHRSKKLEHIWGPGDMESVKRLKREASTLIAEYLTTGDKEEADLCVRKLSVPSFHFQLVRQAVRMALSARDEDRKKILDLLAFFHQTGLIVSDHFTQGFKSFEVELEDVKLDIPTAPVSFAEIIKTAQAAGWLSADYK